MGVKILQSVYFSSQSDEWETPQYLFDELNKEFGFTLDVCALPVNAKCPRFFTPEENGLQQNWVGNVCWMNPPYGREIKKWVQKAYEESLRGTTIVCLLPARTDTQWWHKYVMKANEIRFIRGRLKFSDVNNSAPFPSAIVIFKKHKRNMPLVKTYPLS